MENFKSNITRIKECALEYFMKYGIKSVSMDDIATALGSSKKTIYKYFKDKDTLVEEVIKDTIAANKERMSENQLLAKNVIDEAFLSVECMRETFRKMNPLLIYDLKKYHPRAFKVFTEFRAKYLFNKLVVTIQEGVDQGYFRADIDINTLAKYRIESILIPFNIEFYNSTHQQLHEVHDELFYHFLYGIASPKGYKLISKYILQKNNNIQSYASI